MEPVEPKVPNLGQESPNLLSRLSALWIWSVFFGLNGGLSYSLLQNQPTLMNLQLMALSTPMRGPWGGMNVPSSELWIVVVPICTGIGMIASIAAWVFLYLFFTCMVIPVVLLGTPILHEDRRRRLAALYLARTYQLLILAALARFTPELFGLMIPLLSRLGAI